MVLLCLKHDVFYKQIRKCQVREFRELSKKHPDSNKIKHIFLSFSITIEQSIYEQNIIVYVSSSSKAITEKFSVADNYLSTMTNINLSECF
jgi:hypothetical protein